MGTTNLHTNGSLVFGGTGAFNLDQLTERSIDPAGRNVLNAAGGAVDPSFVGLMSQDPMITCSTTEIVRALAAIDSLAGVKVDSAGARLTSLNCYFTFIPNFGVRGGSSTHFRVGGIAKALVVPRQLTVQQDAEATLSLEIHVLSSDGSTVPWTYTDSVSLPHTPYVDQKFTLGPASINGTAVPGLIRLTIDFGLKVEVKRYDGVVFPTRAHIVERRPMITLQTDEVLTLSTFGISGTAQSSTASTFYLQKLSTTGRVAAASTVHFKVATTASQGKIECKAATGQNGAHATQIVITPIFGSGGAILTYTAGVAIT